MANPEQMKPNINTLLLLHLMGASPFAGMAQGATPASLSGGGSGTYWKGDPGMDDATLGAALQGSSGRGETGGFPGSKQQPRDRLSFSFWFTHNSAQDYWR
mgnify:CR=1 FL=1